MRVDHFLSGLGSLGIQVSRLDVIEAWLYSENYQTEVDGDAEWDRSYL